MPHETVWEERGIYWKYYGSVTLEEILEANYQLFSDSRFENHDYWIWDGADIEDLQMEPADPDVPATKARATNVLKPCLKGALVVNDTIREQIQRYVDTSLTIGSSWEFRIFDNIEDARNWAMA